MRIELKNKKGQSLIISSDSKAFIDIINADESNPIEINDEFKLVSVEV